MTRPGRRVAAAIAVTESEEVFVARIASGLQTRSSSAKICRLISIRSGTTSIARSAPPAAANTPAAGRTRPRISASCSGVRRAPAHARPRERGFQDRQAPAERLLIDLDRDHADASTGENLGDARPHACRGRPAATWRNLHGREITVGPAATPTSPAARRARYWGQTLSEPCPNFWWSEADAPSGPQRRARSRRGRDVREPVLRQPARPPLRSRRGPRIRRGNGPGPH